MFFPVFPIWRTIIYITTDVLLLFDDLVWQVTMDEELRTIGGNTIERGTTCDGTISQQQQINSGKQQKAQALLFWSHKSLSHRHHSCLRLEFQTSQCTRRSSGNLEGMGSCSPHFFTGTMVGGLSTHLTTCEESPPPPPFVFFSLVCATDVWLPVGQLISEQTNSRRNLFFLPTKLHGLLMWTTHHALWKIWFQYLASCEDRKCEHK